MAMQSQMEKGIPLLPRHNNGFGRPVEWDEVLGRTIKADVERADVVGAAENLEAQYILRVTSQLYTDDSVATKLLERLDMGQQVGQSIGGWFLSVRVITNSDDEVERVIVDDVELDHLALTRAPANPDSNGLYTLRSRLQEMVTAERHVVRVDENEDGTVSVTYKREEEEEEEVEETRAVEERDVVPFQNLPLAPEDDVWEWNTKTQNDLLGPDGDDWSRYKKAHTWFNPDEADIKAGYKLPIARMYGGTLKVVFRGVSAAMAALNGARGGVDIPDSERQKVYQHLSKYYGKFDKEPPKLQSFLVETNIMPDENIKPETVVENSKQVEEVSSNGVTTVRALDEPIKTVQADDSAIDLSNTPADVLENAVRSNPPTPTQLGAEQMSDSILIKQFEEMLNRSIGGLSDRVQNLEARATQPAAPVAAPESAAPDTTVEPLERRLAAAEAALVNLTEQPIRRGIAQTNIRPGVGATTQFESLIERARDTGTAPTLCTIMERHKETLAEENGMNKMSVNQLRDLLSAGLRACVNDGLLHKSTADWQ